MDLGERKSSSSVSDLREVSSNVEPLSEARTKLTDFFSVLLGNFLLCAGASGLATGLLFYGRRCRTRLI